MYADRHERAKPDPVSLTAAIGINAALVAALLLSAPDILPDIERTMGTFNVPEKIVPPPVPEDPPKPKTAVPREIKMVAPVPDILPPIPLDTVITATTELQPPVDFGSPAGTGTKVAVDPPKAAPVLTEAAPDPRAEFQPDYPASERRAGVAGIVTVRVLVGADGRVKAVEQVRSVGDAFFAATKRQALSRWRFKPATRDGVAYESWRTMTVRFVLEG